MRSFIHTSLADSRVAATNWERVVEAFLAAEDEIIFSALASTAILLQLSSPVGSVIVVDVASVVNVVLVVVDVVNYCCCCCCFRNVRANCSKFTTRSSIRDKISTLAIGTYCFSASSLPGRYFRGTSKVNLVWCMSISVGFPSKLRFRKTVLAELQGDYPRIVLFLELEVHKRTMSRLFDSTFHFIQQCSQTWRVIGLGEAAPRAESYNAELIPICRRALDAGHDRGFLLPALANKCRILSLSVSLVLSLFR